MAQKSNSTDRYYWFVVGAVTLLCLVAIVSHVAIIVSGNKSEPALLNLAFLCAGGLVGIVAPKPQRNDNSAIIKEEQTQQTDHDIMVHQLGEMAAKSIIGEAMKQIGLKESE